MNIRSFLVDTNILSETQKQRPKQNVRRWLFDTAPVAIPYPVIGEIEWGIASRARHDPEGAAALREWFDRLLATVHYFPAMTPEVAKLEARMMELPALTNLWFSQAGSRRRAPGRDLCIAAVAIEHHLPIATLDVWDFQRIHKHFPLPGLYNPESDEWAVPFGHPPRRPVRTALTP